MVSAGGRSARGPSLILPDFFQKLATGSFISSETAQAGQYNAVRPPLCLALCESHGPNGEDLLAAFVVGHRDAGSPTVEVTIGDDRRSPDDVTQLVDALALRGVRQVIGHFGSATAKPAAAAYGERHMLFLAPGSSAPDLCGPLSPTTLQFFSTDVAQCSLFAHDERLIGKVLIACQSGNSGSSIGWQLFLDLLRTRQHEAGILYLKPDQEKRIATRELAGVGTLCLMGSQEFSSAILMDLRARGLTLPVLLSDDSYGSEALASITEPGDVAVAFPAAVEESCALSFDRPFSDVEAEAAELLGRQPGAYFETSYIAVRALLSVAAQNSGADFPSNARIRRTILSSHYRSSRGVICFDAAGRLIGHEWQFHAPSGAGPADIQRGPLRPHLLAPTLHPHQANLSGCPDHSKTPDPRG